MKMMKRMFSLLLALVLVAGMLPRFAVEAEAAGLSASCEIGAFTYNFTLTRFDFLGNSYLSEANQLSFESCSREGNTISLRISVVAPGVGVNGNDVKKDGDFSFTDTNCTAPLNTTISYSYGPNRLWIEFNVTRDAGSHTGGTATCTTLKSCSTCGQKYGELDTTNGHIYYDNWFNGQVEDEWKHWKACAFDSTHQTSIGICAVGNNGTAATCTAAAICGTCGQSFGKALDHRLDYDLQELNGRYSVRQSCLNNCGHTKNADLTFGSQSFTYTGQAIVLDVNNVNHVKLDDGWIGSLTFESYKNNTNVGTAKVHIKEINKDISFSIVRAPLTVTADAKTITYGDAMPELTYTISGFVNNETAATALNGMSAIQMATSYQQGNNAGEYDITFVGGNAATYGNYKLSYVPGKLTVNKAQPTVTAPKAKELTYTGNPHALVEAGTTAGSYQYHLGDGSWSSDIPEGINAGEYKVYWKFTPTDVTNYAEFTCSEPVTVTIARATPTVAAPASVPNLVYDGSEQELVTASSETGKYQYRLSENESWSDKIPTGKTAGKYEVYWKFVPTDGDNYKDVECTAPVTVTIAKADPGPFPDPINANTLTYNGTGQELAAVSTSLYYPGHFEFALGENTQTAPTTGWSADIPMGTDAKDYIVWWKFVGDENHNDIAPSAFTKTIEPLNIAEIASVGLTMPTWNGSEQTVVPTSVKTSGTNLDVTYTLSGNKGTAVGQYEMTITGTDNFCGEFKSPWYINPDETILDGITDSNVTSDNQNAIDKAQRMVQTANLDSVTDEATKKEMADVLDTVDAKADVLEKKLDDAMAATYTENVAKGLAITADNAKVSDKAALTAAKADLEEALTTYATNYTAEEQKTLNDEIKRLEGIIADIATAEAAAKAVEDLPATMPPDSSAANKEKLEDAREAYDALTAAQKKIVDNSTSSKLTKLEAQVVDIDKIEGSGRWIKGSGKDLVLIFNGPHDSLKWVEVDDKVLSTKHYTVAKGSTIITFKSEYLQTLSHGRHSVVAVYEIDGQELRSNDDGESVAISVRKAASNANTGDSFNMTLWVGIAAVSVIAAIVLLVILKKEKK